MKKNYSNIHELCIIGLMTALICVIAPLSIPMPLGVPMTLQTFIITLCAIILGARQSVTATCIYILLGAFGLPVFSNFTGGWQVITGPTGGFILSFPIMACVIGIGAKYRSRFKGSLIISILIGNAINLFAGTAMFCFLSGCTLLSGMTACVLPFLPITVIKIVLSWVVGLNIRHRIVD